MLSKKKRVSPSLTSQSINLQELENITGRDVTLVLSINGPKIKNSYRHLSNGEIHCSSGLDCFLHLFVSSLSTQRSCGAPSASGTSHRYHLCLSLSQNKSGSLL